MITLSTSPTTSARAKERPTPEPRRRKLDIHRKISGAIIAVIVIVQVYPLAWLFVTSIRTEGDFANGNPFALPTQITFDNYVRAFASGNLGLNILNSLIV